MSQCFRTLPGRLSSFVSGGNSSRRPLSKLDRLKMQKSIESSAFLKQFLGTQRALSIKANITNKSVPFMGFSPSNLSFRLDIHNQWNERLAKRCMDNESKNSMIYWTENPRKLQKSQKFSVTLMKNKKHIAPIGITSDNVTIFQTKNIIRNIKNNSFLDDNRITLLESLCSNQETNITLDKNIVFTSDNANALKTSLQQKDSPSPQENEGKPSQEQLQFIVDCLSQDLPKLFVKTLNFSVYTEDVIFINNIRGTTTKGLVNYVKQIMLLRMIGHMKFAHVKLDIIKITMHPENDTVQVRWRIRGVSGWKVLIMFWKFKIWKLKDAIGSTQEIWYDGFSTFYVNANGKIYKHIADKMMPDQDTVKKEDLRIEPKLALFTSLASIFGSSENSLN